MTTTYKLCIDSEGVWPIGEEELRAIVIDKDGDTFKTITGLDMTAHKWEVR